MWFMLNKIKDGPIELIRRTPTGDEKHLDFACFKMNDEHILLGINHFTRLVKHNFYAISNDIEEVVNLQLFENIMDNYKVDIDNLDKGYFIFTDSIPIIPEESWRCDSTKYGPLSYGVTEGIEEQAAKSLDDLLAYDPILSVDGIAHLIYIHFKNDAEYRDYYANSAKLPNAGVTISEALKLIVEWATVADEPFNNQQGISQDAKEFINKLDFDSSLVAYQVDMYVAEFLKGNPDARKRPFNVLPLSSELDLFIKKKMAYRCLSALISLYPQSFDLQKIIDVEYDSLIKENKNITQQLEFSSNTVALDIFRQTENATMRLYEKIKTTGTF